MIAGLVGCPPEEEIAAALVATAKDVFKVMLDADIEQGCLEHIPQLPCSGVLAVLGFSGTCTGAGLLWCTPEDACRVAEVMLMSEYSEATDEVLDAVGELANMIVGNVKSDLEPRIGPLSLSTPTVIYGADFRARKGQATSWTTVTFKWNEAVFVAGIGLTGCPEEDAEGTDCGCAQRS